MRARKRSLPRRSADSRAMRTKATMSSAATSSTAAVPTDAAAVTTLAAAESQYTGFHTVTISKK